MDFQHYMEALFAHQNANVMRRIVRTSSTRILPQNDRRAGLLIHNTTNVDLFIRFGDGEVTPTQYSTKIPAQETFSLFRNVAEMPESEVKAVLPTVEPQDLVSVDVDSKNNKFDDDLTNAMLRGAIGETGTITGEFTVTTLDVQGALKILGGSDLAAAGSLVNADMPYSSLEDVHQVDQILSGSTPTTISFGSDGDSLQFGGDVAVEGTDIVFQADVMVTEFTTDNPFGL